MIVTLYGCDDDATVTIYDKTILQQPIGCMQLQVTPPNSKYEKTLRRLYPFTKECPLQLTLSYKAGITCNSTYNIQQKSLNGFPSAYINLELRQGFRLKYSYYKDLDEAATSKDIEKGFKRLESDLHLDHSM